MSERERKEPWRRISLRVTPSSDDLTWSEALANPCGTCSHTSCCTHLALHEFDVDGITDLDYARYVLNFDHILLGITPDRKWHVYYRAPCSHLALDTFRCTVHGTDAQPNVCKMFNPYACWYKAAHDGPASDTLIPVDRVRFDWIVERVRFGEDRAIAAMPSLAEMSAAFPHLPVVEDPPGPWDALVASDPVYPAWRAAIEADAPGESIAPRTFTELADPCAGCAAYCCTTLVFPQQPPVNHTQVDYFRYAINFPGVELGVAAGGWTITIRTRCRHLAGTRCGVYGTPERPLLCGFYDQHKCGYKHQFALQRPAGVVRVRAADFDAVAGAFRFNDSGMSMKIPNVEEVRAAIEASWRAGIEPGATIE